MPRFGLAPWLRRGLEAAVAAAIVALATLASEMLSAGAAAYPLPSGITGALYLAPAVLALSVIPAAYPLAMSATRGDAILGAVAGFIVAADATIIVAGRPLGLAQLERNVPGGLLVVLLALVPAIAGLIGGQTLTPLGFGRRAGALGAVVAAIATAVVLVAMAMIA